MDANLPNVLKRCLSAPLINSNNCLPITSTTSSLSKNTTSISNIQKSSTGIMASTTTTSGTITAITNSPSRSREASPAPVFNIFAPRARRYSASFASLGGGATSVIGGNGNGGPRLTPRVSQLRQEECIDMNSREMNHEREIHSALQISQSWEDLTLVAETWSCKSDDLSNPLQVTLPTGPPSCSSPSPTSRGGVRLPYGLSPSPTRRTFATRRSMSPIAMRPSQLGPVKRKFELEENTSNWSTCSPPPLKKIFTESRGPSPICQSPSSICPSPDSGTYEGRITPKLFNISKLCSSSLLNSNTNTNSSSSICSSPSMIPSPLMDVGIDLQSSISSSAVSSPLSLSSVNTVSSSSQETISSQDAINVVQSTSDNDDGISKNPMSSLPIEEETKDESGRKDTNMIENDDDQIMLPSTSSLGNIVNEIQPKIENSSKAIVLLSSALPCDIQQQQSEEMTEIEIIDSRFNIKDNNSSSDNMIRINDKSSDNKIIIENYDIKCHVDDEDENIEMKNDNLT